MSQLNARNTAAPKGEKRSLATGTDILARVAIVVLMLDLSGTVTFLLSGGDTVSALASICILVSGLSLHRGLEARETWAWLGATLVFMTRTMMFFAPVLAHMAYSSIRYAYLLTLETGVMLSIAALFTALYGCAATALFRGRTEFGVDARRGWPTLTRRGWPLCLILGGLNTALLVRLMLFWKSLE